MKSWVAKFKTLTKGKKPLHSYMKYLNNNEHINHTKTGHLIITPLENDYNHYFKNFCILNEEERTKKIIAGVGGRPNEKFCQSITLNLPFHLKPHEYKEIGDKILKKFMIELYKMEDLKLTKQKFEDLKENLLYYNIHRQPEGSKTQFNFLIPEIYEGKKLNLTKKKYSHLFRFVSNGIMREYGHDINDYEVINEHKQNKNINDYKENKFDTILEDIKSKINDINHLKNDFEKEFKRLDTYYNRMVKHIGTGDLEQAEKNKTYIINTLTKVNKKVNEEEQELKKIEDKKTDNPPKQREEKPEQSKKFMRGIFKN